MTITTPDVPEARAVSFHGMIGGSAPMQSLFKRIELAAPRDISVLVLGETGTGKELVARAIQRLSARRDRPFVVVNCGAFARDLLTSELFGHERGAFTGAVARKEGRLAMADGGTVFLDEIGDLPLDGQVMLPRFLQSGEIEPVGSTQTRRVDVRVIAATNRKLEGAIERETFRGDLYYRLCEMNIEVPPLRARREDLPLLVEHIRTQTNVRCDLAIEGVTREALDLIDGHPWPGNVRELEAVLKRAMVLRCEGWVRPEDLEVSTADASLPPTLTWFQREALRLADERHELRRAAFMARCGISRQVAGRELAALVRAGLLRKLGAGRGARYLPTG